MSKHENLIEAFRAELLRWNKQINLVSRQETEDRLEGLFYQCSTGVDALLDFLNPLCKSQNGGLRLFYFDLGSGGGLPGVVWHARLASGSLPVGTVQSWFVEPREKRAWFLNRLNRIPNMPTFGVLHGRWGDVATSGVCFSNNYQSIPVFVTSLKALHLNDLEVLAGLGSAFSVFPPNYIVLIARYYPPEQKHDTYLVQQLQISEKGTLVEVGGRVYTATGAEVRPLPGDGHGLASLVFSSYSIS